MECVLHQVIPGKHLEIKGHKTDHVLQLDMPARAPRVFKFENLVPNATYQIKVPVLSEEDSLSEFKTLPEDIRSINIAMVSCDKRGFEPVKGNMWQEMWRRIESKKDDIHILLHMGDNVYIDGDVSHNLGNKDIVASRTVLDPETSDQTIPYVQARRILHDTPKEEWHSKARDQILEIYREEYRLTLNRKYKALVMAHVSNLMILDDHDIRDDFGGVPEDSDPDSAEFFLGHVAMRVFHEYQRALWDPDVINRDLSAMTSEFFALTFGPVGVMMLDSRTVWSINKSNREDEDLTYYGNPQMESVKSNFKNSDIKFWIMVCPLPLIFLKKKLNDMIASVADRADDLKCFINVRHQKDLQTMFKLMREWRQEDPTRDLAVVSGDVHIAGFTDIYHDPPSGGARELVCHQITSSAINNERPGEVGMAAVRFLLDFTESYGDYTYKHYDWINLCNYAVISLERFVPDLQYKVKLVHQEGVIVKKSTEQDWDGRTKSCSCAVL